MRVAVAILNSLPLDVLLVRAIYKCFKTFSFPKTFKNFRVFYNFLPWIQGQCENPTNRALFLGMIYTTRKNIQRVTKVVLTSWYWPKYIMRKSFLRWVPAYKANLNKLASLLSQCLLAPLNSVSKLMWVVDVGVTSLSKLIIGLPAAASSFLLLLELNLAVESLDVFAVAPK